MEQFEKVAISTAPHPPSLWVRYVDDTFTVLHEYDVEEFTEHINSIDPHIKFTIEPEKDSKLPFLDLCTHILDEYDVEEFTEHINSIDPHIKFTIEPEKDSKLPFLDLCTHILDDGSTKITVYRKPTHTEQYLNFKSHHPLIHKHSVVRTLTNKAQQYVTSAEDRKSELAHVHKALRANGYPEWALAPPPSSAKRPPNTNNNPRRPMLRLPYVAGLSEQLGRLYKSHNIHMYHKPANTLRSMVVHPKDKTPKEHKCGTIYNITCDIDSSHTYIGETKRTLSQRFKEHTNLDKPTGVGDHCRATGHSVSLKNTEILTRESNWRKVKELYILNREPLT